MKIHIEQMNNISSTNKSIPQVRGALSATDELGASNFTSFMFVSAEVATYRLTCQSAGVFSAESVLVDVVPPAPNPSLASHGVQMVSFASSEIIDELNQLCPGDLHILLSGNAGVHPAMETIYTVAVFVLPMSTLTAWIFRYMVAAHHRVPLL